MRPAVFLDRDDTLIANRSLGAIPGQRAGDLADPQRVELLTGALEACRLLKHAGFSLVIVSNQGVVARGGATIERVEETNDKVLELLADAAGGSLIDAVYYCPYHPDGSVPAYAREHPWRKPQPGMILAGAADLDLDLSRSWLIGDAPRDCDAGIAAGIDPARCLLIDQDSSNPADVLEAAMIVLASADPADCSTARLVADGTPLADDRVCETVLATARAIAERIGVQLLEVRAHEGGIEATIAGPEVVAVGFVAELRRLTNAWHRARTGRDLWPGTGSNAESDDGSDGPPDATP